MQTMYGNSVSREGFFPATESVFPFSNPQLKEERAEASVLTYYNNDGADFAVSKKRPREAPTLAGVGHGKVSGWYAGESEPDYLLGRDASVTMMQQQFEVDRLIFLHMEKVKMEMEEQRRNQSNRMIRAIGGALANRMRVKEQQMEKMREVNAGLYERVKSLHIENQLWRDMAQSNEATANALRSSLDQVLAQVNCSKNRAGEEEEEEESCCGSSGHVDEEERMCRGCGGAESSVLVLPCRHLCLCGACGPTMDVCPVCNSVKSATLHVKFS